MKYLIIIICVFFNISCLTIKPGATKSGIKFYESFYIGEGVNQYFVKPLSLSNGVNDFFIDFTLRDQKSKSDSCAINFTLITPFITKNIDSLVISSKSDKVVLTDSKLFFINRVGKSFNARFSATLQASKLHKLFKDNQWQIIVYNSNKIEKFEPTKKTLKTISILNKNLFQILSD
jgi:hypothetical protein